MALEMWGHKRDEEQSKALTYLFSTEGIFLWNIFSTQVVSRVGT